MKSPLNLLALLLLIVVVNLAVNSLTQTGAHAGIDGEKCVTGDVTGDYRVTLLDAMQILNYLYLDGDDPIACAENFPTIPALTVPHPDSMLVLADVDIAESRDSDNLISTRSLKVSTCN